MTLFELSARIEQETLDTIHEAGQLMIAEADTLNAGDLAERCRDTARRLQLTNNERRYLHVYAASELFHG